MQTWLPPAIIASLIGSLLLTAVFFYLYQTTDKRSPFLGIWAAAWAIGALRMGSEAAALQTGWFPLLTIANQLFALTSSLLASVGMLHFLGWRIPRWLPVVAAVDAAWITVATAAGWPALWLTLPTYTFTAVVYIVTGIALLRSAPTRGIAAQTVGWAFVLWGIHKADYPFLHQVESFAPLGYLLAATLELITAMGIVLLYFERTRHELQQSEQRYRLLVENSTDYIARLDRSSRALYVNPALGQLSRQQRDLFRWLDSGVLTLADEMLSKALAVTVQQVFESGEEITTELSYDVDGLTAIYQARLTPEFGPNGQVDTVLLVARDITALKDAEVRLQRANRQLEELIEAAPVAITAITLDGKITLWNPAAERIFGWKAEEVYGKPLPFIPPEQQMAFDRHLRIVTSGEPVSGIETERVRKDGSRVRLLLSSAPLRDESGEVVGAMALNVDITERRQAEAALRAREQQYRDLVESMSSAVLVYEAENGGEDFVIRDINPAGERISQLPWGEIVGQRVTEIYPSTPQTGVLAMLRQTHETRAPATMPLAHYTDGRLSLWVDGHAYPLPDGRVAAVFNDVTQRQLAEQKLALSEEKFRRIFKESPMGLALLGANRTVTDVNPAFVELLGLADAHAVIGSRSADLLQIPASVTERVQTGAVVHREIRLNFAELASSGFQTTRRDQVWLDMLVSRLRPSTDNSPDSFLVHLQDVTALHRRNRELATLLDLNRQLTSQLDLDQLIAHIVESVVAVLPDAEAATLWLLDEANDAIQLRAVAGYDPALAGRYAVPASTGLMGEIIRSGIPCWIPDTSKEPLHALSEAPELNRVVSVIGVPLTFEGHTIGALFADNLSRSGAFDTGEVSLLQSLADQASLALRNAQLFEAEQHEQALAQALRHSAETLVRELDIDEALEAISEDIMAIIPVDRIAVLVDDQGSFRIASVRGAVECAPGTQIALAPDVTEQIYAALGERRVLHLEDRRGTEWAAELPCYSPDVSDWLGLPLIAHRVLLGMLTVGRSEGTFTPQQIELLSTFANQAAVAIEKARIVQELEHSLRQVREAQDKVTHSARLSAIGEMAAGVAHQINNPLMTVLLDSNLLLSELDSDASGYESAAAIHRAAQQAGHVVQRLLDYARVRPQALEPVDVVRSVTEAIELVRPQLRSSGARIDVSLEPNLPPVLATTEHLKDVWINLLLNARDAIRPREDGTIRVTCHRADPSHVKVRISDNGEGILAANLESIFDPFFTTKEQGSGLGLAVCEDIVSHLGGRIQVDSTPGIGTTFTVTLPAAAAPNLSTPSGDATWLTS